MVQLGYGKNQVRFRATMTDRTSSIAVDLASNKDETKRMLIDAAIPVAKGVCIVNESEVHDAIASVGFPLVFKPLDGNHGKGVLTWADLLQLQTRLVLPLMTSCTHKS